LRGFLRPSEHESNENLEALAIEVAEKSVKKLSDNLIDSLLKLNPMSRVIQANDGYAVASIIKRPQDYDLSKTRYATKHLAHPFLLSPIHNPFFCSVFPALWAPTTVRASFVLGVARALETCVSENVFPKAETLDMMKKLSEHAISVMDIAKFRTKATLLAPQPRGYYNDVARLSPTQLALVTALVTDPAALADFFKTCLHHG
jgi:hypothetical protein